MRSCPEGAMAAAPSNLRTILHPPWAAVDDSSAREAGGVARVSKNSPDAHCLQCHSGGDCPSLARLGHADSHQICPVLKVDRPCHRAPACQSRLCDVDFPPKLMDRLPYKPISSVPKLANRTPFAFVVDSLLVRAADYSVGHRDR
jgi:hypothetical protein